MKRIFISGVIMAFIITLGFKDLNAAGVVQNNSYAPTVTDATLAPLLNPLLTSGWASFINTIDTTIKENWNSQNKLANGLGNANAYSSQAANLDGYHGYDLFAIMVGFGFGAQFPNKVPSNPIDMKNAPSDALNDIKDKGDVYAGLGVGAAVNFGVNGKIIGFKNIYFNVKYGTYSYDTTDKGNELKAKMTTFGLGVNYQWVAHKNLIANIVKWRGITFGSGLQYNQNKVDMTVAGLENIYQDLNTTPIPGYGTYRLALSPDIKLGYDAKTYTIPFDVNTSLRVLWLLNLNVGAGVDLVFGKTDINIGQTSTAWIENAATGQHISTDGQVVIDASTKNVKPTFLRPRVQIGAGVTIGPLTAVNLSVTYYIPDGAYAGVSAGIVW